MEIDCVVLGEFETNCYVLRGSTPLTAGSGEQSRECLIIDAGFGAGGLIEFLNQRKLSPVAVILTHGHIDHIAGVDDLRQQYPDIRLYVHKLDAGMLADPNMNLAVMLGRSCVRRDCRSDVLLEDASSIELAGLKLLVIHTPGHTPGGICLYCQADGVVFTDDALFAGSIGRTDFPGGDMDRLLKGIRQKVLTLPGKTVVYPGHGPRTTIAEEKANNPFFFR